MARPVGDLTCPDRWPRRGGAPACRRRRVPTAASGQPYSTPKPRPEGRDEPSQNHSDRICQLGPVDHLPGGQAQCPVAGAGGRDDRCAAPSKRSRFITLSQAATKSLTNFSFVVAGVDLGEARSCELEPKTRSTRVPVHLTRRSRGRGPRTPSPSSSVGDFHSVPMSSRLTKKSLVSVPGRSVKTPCWDCRGWRRARAGRRRAPSSPARSASAAAPIDQQQVLGRDGEPPGEVVAEAVGLRLERANDSTSVCSCDASVRPGEKGTSHRGRRPSPPSRRRRSRPARSGRRARPSCRRTARVERLLDLLERRQHLGAAGPAG
jgi:hypothetical protein